MNKHVHRGLRLGDNGPDVEQLQWGINRKATSWKLNFLSVVVDGELGPVTLNSGTSILYAMGVYGKTMRRARNNDVLSEYAQRLLRGTRPRTEVMKALSLARRPKVRSWRLNTGPRIVHLGRAISNVFGPLGPFYATSGHYTGGPVPVSDSEGLALFRAYHEYHRRLGWGGLSYSYIILPTGTLILGHDVRYKAAHVAYHNSGNVGIVCPGTTGDRATAAQQRTLQWLINNAHTDRLPVSHRLPRPITSAEVVLRPHQDWPNNATGCPGDFRRFYESRGHSR